MAPKAGASAVPPLARGELTAHPLQLVEEGLKVMGTFRASDWKTAAIHVAASADFYAIASRFVPSLAEQERKAREVMRKHRITSGSASGRRD